MSWACPRCGAKFATRNASHSCVKQTLAEFFAGKPRDGVRHAKALIATVRELGPVTLHPVKTRVALMVDVRFAAINRIGEDSIRGHIWLREAMTSDRFVKIEKLGARDWLYHFVVSDEQPIDAELRKFLRGGYANGKRA
ncbi:MAG TPA: DUF5655 domain-containing protein [Kofleriaceae bacterium]